MAGEISFNPHTEKTVPKAQTETTRVAGRDLTPEEIKLFDFDGNGTIDFGKELTAYLKYEKEKEGPTYKKDSDKPENASTSNIKASENLDLKVVTSNTIIEDEKPGKADLQKYAKENGLYKPETTDNIEHSDSLKSKDLT